MDDQLVPVRCFRETLPAGLSFVYYDGSHDVLGEPVDPQDPAWADYFVDLSAPVDGDRLDALPWAIGVLAGRFRSAGDHPHPVPQLRWESAGVEGPFQDHLKLSFGAGHVELYKTPERSASHGCHHLTTVLPEAWAARDARRIIAAALREGVGLEVTQ